MPFARPLRCWDHRTIEKPQTRTLEARLACRIALTGDDNADASARAKCGLEVFDEFVSATTYVSPDDETAVGAAWRDAEQLADKALLEWSRVFLR